MKTALRLFIVSLLAGTAIFGTSANAATPKAGALCTAKNSITKIGGKDFICAVKPAEWNKSHKLYWQDFNTYSNSVDSVRSKLSKEQKYQYCLIQFGGPLPGEKGSVSQQIQDQCAHVGEAPSSGNKSSSSTTIVQPSGAPVSAASWDPAVTLKYLACLKQYGFEPKATKDLIMAKDSGSQKTALENCKADQPFYLNR
jgi:hypothetical protein